MHTLRRRSRTLLRRSAFCVGTSRLAPPAAQSVAEFYTGKTITISVGYSPGGSYDFYPRVFARYLGKYIPGNPTVVVQNMPGAGSLRAANFLYNVAPKDGTALGVVTQTVMLEAPLGTPGVKYNAVEFTYVGRMTGVLETMISWHEAPAKNIHEARKYETDRRRHRADLADRRLSAAAECVRRHQIPDRVGLRRHRRDHAGDGAARGRRAGEFLELDRAHQARMARDQEDQRADPGGARAQQGTAGHADAGRDGQDAGGQGGARLLYQRRRR